MRTAGIQELAGRKVLESRDYLPGLDGLPKSDVLKYLFEGNASVVVRPSGTEPKLKLYFSVSAEDKEKAEVLEQRFVAGMEKLL